MRQRDLPSPLTAQLAQEIAGDISRIIGLNVLITDRDAVVIGSGDVDRLDAVHEASVEVIRTAAAAEHTAAQARALSGVRPGMTLPIVLDGEVVGTVGLTGSPQRVRPFALVVQRQTEILLREAILMQSRALHDRALTDLVRDVTVHDPGSVGAGAVARRARELGIEPARSRAVVLVDPGAARRADAGPRSALRLVRDEFSDVQDVVAEITAGLVAVLCHLPARPGAAELGDLRTRCLRLVERLRGDHGPAPRIGVGAARTDLAGLHASYVDALDALAVGSPTHGADDGVRDIGRLRVPQLLAALDDESRARYLDATLGALRSKPDWPVLRRTLIAWAECGFNLVRASAALHIHRSSLLYRLDKIAERTGRSPRDPRHGLQLYLAAVLDDLPA